jgi:hypothetical protein
MERRGEKKGASKPARSQRRLITLFSFFASAHLLLLFVFLFIFTFLLISPPLQAQEGYLNFSFWSRSQVYSQLTPFYTNAYENIFHLDLFQRTVNYGYFNGLFDGRISSSGFEAAHWYFGWQGIKAGQFSFNLKLGDDSFQFTNLGYRFTNYFPAYNYLRGVKIGFEYKGFGLDFFTGRVARLSGLLGTVYDLTEQTVNGFLGHFEPGPVYYFGFGFLHSENERSWTGELLTRSNDLLLLESELKINNNFKLVTETQASFSLSESETARAPGTSIRFGPLINYDRWGLEVNYRRIDADFKGLSGESIFDRDQEGLFTTWRYQLKKGLYFFGSVDYYHDNVDRRPELNTTDFWRIYSGFSLISPPWPDLTLRLDFNAAESRKQDEYYRHYLSPGFYLQLSKYLGKFYPYLRVRFQHFDDRVNDQRDFTYPSIFLGLRYSYLRNSYIMAEAENTRYYDYLQNRLFTQNRYRLANYSPFFLGTDFYGEISYSNYAYEYYSSYGTKRLELFLGLSKQLPWKLKLRLDLRTSWPIASSQPANYWITLRIDRRFNWGEAPTFQGRAYGQVLGGAGKIEGLIFADQNLNGVYDPGEKVFPGLTIQLEDGSYQVTNYQGRYLFPRVPEGLHTVSLDLKQIPAEFYLLSPERQTVVVEKRKVIGLNFALIEGGTIGGKIFQDTNKNGLFDGEDQPLKDVLVWLKPVAREGLSPALEKLRAETLNTYTDEKGNFIFENILPGPYELSIDEETLPKGIKQLTELPLKVELKPGQQIKDLKIIYLPRPIIFTGKSRLEK